MGRKAPRHRRAGRLVISLLIFALLPTPWPKVEFHNVRHHDELGQLCEYHDHLLRWHPDAQGAQDVAVLHWHWAWPSPGMPDADHDSAGPRLHAFVGTEALPTLTPPPAIVVDTGGPQLAVPAAQPASAAWGCTSVPSDLLATGSSPPRALTFSATFAPRTSLTSRLHRWSC